MLAVDMFFTDDVWQDLCLEKPEHESGSNELQRGRVSRLCTEGARVAPAASDPQDKEKAKSLL